MPLTDENLPRPLLLLLIDPILSLYGFFSNGSEPIDSKRCQRKWGSQKRGMDRVRLFISKGIEFRDTRLIACHGLLFFFWGDKNILL